MRQLLSPLVVVFAAIGHLAVAKAQEDVAENKYKAQIDPTPIVEAPLTAADRSHWAFRPLERPSIPAAKAANWVRTGIDAFILAKLEAASIPPSPEANRAALLRRLTFDLTGLPPTPEQVAEFERDSAPDAYEQQVDRLLASPAFGERYAQHWLDFARFAETDGYEHDKVRPQAWRYRDWVIAALNADLPYDEFIRQQIAGDEPSAERGTGSAEQIGSALRAPSSALAATFCLAGPDMPDINDQLERRHALLNELTATVGSVFLGLQLGCAQCHDHKYDPISQGDFYRLRAIFEPAVATLKRDVPFNALANQKDPVPARLWIRGDHRRPGVELQPAFPRIGMIERGARNAERGTDDLEFSSALRTPRSALATWLVRPENPLTSRVMANRIWQYHFGRGLCATPSDFGVMGAAVTHPELLDWLATELRDGWQMKRLHRAVVCSATYRQGESAERGERNAELADRKAEDGLYSTFPRQRLGGEVIRDAMLTAAGLMSSERGGPGVMPPLPDELVGTLLKGQWYASKRESDHYKRSIYIFSRRNLRFPIFEAFDRPDGNASCPIRGRSTTAPQSLLLFNSEFSLLVARHLAGRVCEATSDPSEQIRMLYQIVLSRLPAAEEAKTVEAFLSKQRSILAKETRAPAELALPIDGSIAGDPLAAAALVDACLAVLNSNEFVYVD